MTVVDLSASGIGLRAQTLPPTSRLQVSLLWQGQPITLSVELEHAQREDGLYHLGGRCAGMAAFDNELFTALTTRALRTLAALGQAPGPIVPQAI